jgi:hypothetical protein
VIDLHFDLELTVCSTIISGARAWLEAIIPAGNKARAWGSDNRTADPHPREQVIMLPRSVAVALVVLLVAVPVVRADGCKFASDGRKVPEREQRAFVEWADGVETLHVAALSDPITEGSVWVVPVRAAATAVRAEPVEELPAVVYYETLKGRAERRLRRGISFAGLLDSGGLLGIFFIGGCGGAGPPSAIEVSRVENLGMVVTVVSAESRSEIERYLDAQGVKRGAADLSSLDPYFGKGEYAFVCGWVASRREPVRATGLKVVFPSPTIWFPLRPTQAYTNPVETVVYVRGFVKPASGCDLPGLKAQYIYGEVRSMGVGQAFARDVPDHPNYFSDRMEPLTRVTLSTDPQKWDRDLELVPGTTSTGTLALAITGWLGFLGPLWSALLGAALGLLIPRLTIPFAERRWYDRLAGALVGAAIVLSIWASAVVFAIWRRYALRDRSFHPSRYVVLPALAVAHFAIVLAACHGLLAWISAGG